MPERIFLDEKKPTGKVGSTGREWSECKGSVSELMNTELQVRRPEVPFQGLNITNGTVADFEMREHLEIFAVIPIRKDGRLRSVGAPVGWKHCDVHLILRCDGLGIAQSVRV